jgi:hypothetical protein
MHHWTYRLEKRQQKKRKNWKTKPMLQNSHEQSIFAALKPTRSRFFLLQRTDPSASKNTPRREKQTDSQTDRDAQYNNLLQFLPEISPECPTPESSQPREHFLLIHFRPLNPEFGSLIEATTKARNPHL